MSLPNTAHTSWALVPSQSSSCAVRTLSAIRWKLGELLGWDDVDAGPESDALPFTSLYLTDDEWAAEGANRTMHGVIHIGRVPDDAGGFRAQMAVLVKPNCLLGSAYIVAIMSGSGGQALAWHPRSVPRDASPRPTHRQDGTYGAPDRKWFEGGQRLARANVN